MKRITLKRLTLVNFKGARQLQADFGAEATEVRGRNGSGKTTLFDAFTWLLFGKDSRDRKAFDIKTLGADGKPYPRLPHEVSAALDIDGEETLLARRFTEKWVKRRGSATEEFAGHEEERLYNGVPCSLKEWNEKIAAICPELAFKFITSPSCFASQKPEAQREMLLKMAGGFSDNEVVAASGQRQDFIDLLGSLCGKTLEEHKREIAAKKRLIKAELDALPERIDERKRDNAQHEGKDYGQIEAEIAQKKQALAEVERQLGQIGARVEAVMNAQNATLERLQAAKAERMKMEADKAKEMLDQYYNAEKQRSDAQRQAERLGSAISDRKERIEELAKQAGAMARQREALLAKRKEISAMRLEFAPGDFVCPTCGQPLDPDNIEKKQAEMAASFNAQKAEMLQANREQGQRCSMAKIEEANAKIGAMRAANQADGAALQLLEEALCRMQPAAKPSDEDAKAALRQQEGYNRLLEEEASLMEELSARSMPSADSAELNEAREVLAEGIEQLKAQLEGRATMQRNNGRIAELEAQLRSQSEELARLEGIEFAIADFGKARIEAMESKINSLFSLVRFKMFDTQINGGEVETCEATADGVPYSAQNSAMRINMGLDIINAICKWQGISAPIFIDNAESVLEPLQTIGQQIRLIVADQDLTIE